MIVKTNNNIIILTTLVLFLIGCVNRTIKKTVFVHIIPESYTGELSEVTCKDSIAIPVNDTIFLHYDNFGICRHNFQDIHSIEVEQYLSFIVTNKKYEHIYYWKYDNNVKIRFGVNFQNAIIGKFKNCNCEYIKFKSLIDTDSWVKYDYDSKNCDSLHYLNIKIAK